MTQSTITMLIALQVNPLTAYGFLEYLKIPKGEFLLQVCTLCCWLCSHIRMRTAMLTRLSASLGHPHAALHVLPVCARMLHCCYIQ